MEYRCFQVIFLKYFLNICSLSLLTVNNVIKFRKSLATIITLCVHKVFKKYIWKIVLFTSKFSSIIIFQLIFVLFYLLTFIFWLRLNSSEICYVVTINQYWFWQNIFQFFQFEVFAVSKRWTVVWRWLMRRYIIIKLVRITLHASLNSYFVFPSFLYFMICQKCFSFRYKKKSKNRTKIKKDMYMHNSNKKVEKLFTLRFIQ